MGCGAGEFQDCKAFFCAELACAGTEGFDTGQWVSLPEDIDRVLEVVFDIFGFCSWWDELGKMSCEGVRSSSFNKELFGFLLVSLHPGLDFLLGVANVLHAGGGAVGTVHYYLLVAFSIVDALRSFWAITGFVWKIKRDNVCCDLLGQVSLEDLSQISMATETHTRTQPGEGGELGTFFFNDFVDQFFGPEPAVAHLKVDGAFAVTFTALDLGLGHYVLLEVL